MYTLFGTKGSGSASAEAALTVAGIEFRSVDAASWDPGPGRDELTRVNPLCQIPTLLLPDGSVLTESAAILIHLGLAHPASGLLPADAAARAQAIRGLVYIAANCYAAIGIIDYPERWCADPDDKTNKRIKAGATQRLHYLWEVFADTYPARPFLGGAHTSARSTCWPRWSRNGRGRASISPPRDRNSARCWRASRTNRAWRRSSRATGRLRPDFLRTVPTKGRHARRNRLLHAVRAGCGQGRRVLWRRVRLDVRPVPRVAPLPPHQQHRAGRRTRQPRPEGRRGASVLSRRRHPQRGGQGARARRQGGEITQSESGLGCLCHDDQGVPFHLWQPAPGF